MGPTGWGGVGGGRALGTRGGDGQSVPSNGVLPRTPGRPMSGPRGPARGGACDGGRERGARLGGASGHGCGCERERRRSRIPCREPSGALWGRGPGAAAAAGGRWQRPREPRQCLQPQPTGAGCGRCWRRRSGCVSDAGAGAAGASRGRRLSLAAAAGPARRAPSWGGGAACAFRGRGAARLGSAEPACFPVPACAGGGASSPPRSWGAAGAAGRRARGGRPPSPGRPGPPGILAFTPFGRWRKVAGFSFAGPLLVYFLVLGGELFCFTLEAPFRMLSNPFFKPP